MKNNVYGARRGMRPAHPGKVGASTIWAIGMAVAMLAGNPARAADYPSHPIKLEVGFPAGGASDVAARAIAARMGAELKQSIIVENRPGAASNLASEYVAKAAPDGYTILFGTISLSINGSLYKNLNFDAVKDFQAVAEVASSPFILMVNPTMLPEVKTVKDLIAAAKAAGDRPLTYATAGNGSGSHLFMELFASMAGIKMQAIPYRGAAPALSDVLGGRVPLDFDNIITSLPLVENGKLRALAMSSATRATSAPTIPTMAEAGVPGYDATAWFGLFVPRGTPAEVVKKISDAANVAVQDPQVRKTLQGLGAEPVVSNPEAYTRFFRSEVDKWAKVIRDANVQIE
jgi:tripartite-type tricarboxylate transporter receptor subunit TctC